MTWHPFLESQNLRMEEQEGQTCVWDMIRKKWLVMLPEEEVRQRMIHHLVNVQQVSPALIGVEKEIRYNELRKRFDAVVFDRQARPFILCECKAPQVPLSQQTLRQIARYNKTLKAPHLLLTNGSGWIFFSRKPDGTYAFQPTGWYE